MHEEPGRRAAAAVSVGCGAAGPEQAVERERLERVAARNWGPFGAPLSL